MNPSLFRWIACCVGALTFGLVRLNGRFVNHSTGEDVRAGVL